METNSDPVESLLHSAGRRLQPPDAVYRQVLAAATATFRSRAARRRRRLWLTAAAAAVVLAGVGMQLLPGPSPVAPGLAVASVSRVIGTVEWTDGAAWQQLADPVAKLASGTRLRTLAGARAGLLLAGGRSLRLDSLTELTLTAPEQLHLDRGTVYLDSGPDGTGGPFEIVTPAGIARELGTRYELRVADAALRLSVREGQVAIERGRQRVTSTAGQRITIDASGAILRTAIAASAADWQWTETVAPAPDIDGRPLSELLAWVARETGRRPAWETPELAERAGSIILRGNIRDLAPLVALDVMLATTDLEYDLIGDRIELRARAVIPPQL